jgi:hypothetical protein
LRKAFGALSHGFEGAALAADGAIGVTFAELAFGLTHGFARIAKFAHFVAALPLLSLLSFLALLALLALLTEPALAELFQKLVEAITQRLLILAQIAHLILALLALLAPLAVAAIFLALFESLVAQLLLLADHVAQFIQG